MTDAAPSPEGATERPGADPDRSPAFSPSRLEAALGCGAFYEFRYVHKLPEPSKASIQLGNWIDDALNMVWNHRLTFGVEHPTDDLLAYAERSFETFTAKVPEWDLDTDAKTIRGRLLTALRTYMDTWGRRLIPTDVQPWIEIPAGVVGTLRVHGKPDLIAEDPVSGGLWVVDHKTKNKAFYGEKEGARAAAEGLLRRNIKMASYAAGLAIAGRVPAGLRYIGLVWTTEPKVQEVDVRVDRKLIAWALHAMQGGARVIEGGSFLPNPTYQWCGTCPFATECETKFGST